MAATAQTTDPQRVAGGLQQAVRAFLAREARIEMPAGEWRERIWFPSPQERRECCAAITPTPANPQALENHCRTLRHLALLFDVPLEELKRAVRKRRSGVVVGGVQERARLSAAPAPAGRPPSALEELVLASRRARREARGTVRAAFDALDTVLSRLHALAPESGEPEGDAEDQEVLDTVRALLDCTKTLRAGVDFWLAAEIAYHSARGAEQALLGGVKEKVSAA